MKEENTYNEIGGNNLPDYLRVNPFGVPQGYFDHLTNNVLAEIAEQKLKQQVSDAGFTVPQDYFIQLEERVQNRLFEQNLKDNVQTEGYQVPQGYFEELTDKIKASVALEQHIATSERKEGFEIPTGYFESLSSKIMDKVTGAPSVQEEKRPDTPVIQMAPRKNWIYQASVAAVAILLGIGSYWYLDRTDPQSLPEDHTQASLHGLSKEDIVQYLAQETDGVELIELASYVDDEEMFDNTSFDIKQRLNDKEIEEYLNYML
ncbi:hypothetical protein G5B35_21225 [Parapusillimonas sp. SGNA-6]|uniref:hypothetical protein n=1 Tax=Parapedobacter sp. SGR-10 TaxID=2710879 RepID=UPI0013D5ED52|nr:hypothetical protein [Parapedobacter sp. SGR-10]NGF56270.1 hypothetical protein [Parapedobacter sp. SGR-10]NGM89826.1 hypothetical protein [Parapusillimonas sp. SGNA-6]